MNRIITFLLLFLMSFGSLLHAQSFTVSTSDSVREGSPGSILVFSNPVVNNTSNDIELDVLRVENAVGPWSSFFCLVACFPPTVDSARVTLPANAQEFLILDVETDAGAPDSQTVLMCIREVANPANMFCQRFYATTKIGSGIHDISSLQVNSHLYPNPVRSGDQAILHVETSNHSAISFHMYNELGKEVMVRTGIKNGNNNFIADLPAGLYFYTLQTGSAYTAGGKILILPKP